MNRDRRINWPLLWIVLGGFAIVAAAVSFGVAFFAYQNGWRP